jgi:hypothetical protein
MITHLAEAGGRTRWEVFLALDDVLESIGTDSDRRLGFQAAHPV